MAYTIGAASEAEMEGWARAIRQKMKLHADADARASALTESQSLRADSFFAGTECGAAALAAPLPSPTADKSALLGVEPLTTASAAGTAAAAAATQRSAPRRSRCALC